MLVDERGERVDGGVPLGAWVAGGDGADEVHEWGEAGGQEGGEHPGVDVGPVFVADEECRVMCRVEHEGAAARRIGRFHAHLAVPHVDPGWRLSRLVEIDDVGGERRAVVLRVAEVAGEAAGGEWRDREGDGGEGAGGV